MTAKVQLIHFWEQLYPGDSGNLLDDFLSEIESLRKTDNLSSDWYKDAVIYSLYVDLFNVNFSGLQNKLDYLQDLGINCLWLLPILNSPMKDAGFDISDYQRIRPELLGLTENYEQKEQKEVFGEFLNQAHQRNINVIFDMAINHTSDKHPWFKEAKKSPDNPFRDFYIWSESTDLYNDARIIFKGIEDSNWEDSGAFYYFHRFFSFQPDLNYRNPKVLLEMTRNMIFWQQMGVDGFRADAIPYLWKEEGTKCENLHKTHTIVKFFRAVLDFIQPGTLILAEACQKPAEVVKYLGDGDECHAAYHFPLMPRLFKSIAEGKGTSIIETLDTKVTPNIPDSTQWFSFLRCHDELSLELVYVTEEDRKFIHENYCHQKLWDFREGEGISARLSELFERDTRKIKLAYSLMLTLMGTPVIYYGDEFGKFNDEAYYAAMIQHTGKDDTRFLVRGKIDWDQLSKDLADGSTFQSSIYYSLKNMIHTRNNTGIFGRGELKWKTFKNENGNIEESIFGYTRKHHKKEIVVIHNLSGQDINIFNDFIKDEKRKDLLGTPIKLNSDYILLEPYEFLWILK